jgi:AcrR family transcriptional regulator
MMDEKQRTRERILNAASERIRHYGYGKTTIAEIAADCGMSSGNIYRFFESKLDMAEAMARRQISEEYQQLAAVARRKDIAPDERLKQMYLLRLRRAHATTMESAKILEMAAVIMRERPEVGVEHALQERLYFKSVLDDGAAAGMFTPGDQTRKADALVNAMGRFTVGLALAMDKDPLEQIERELLDLLTLLLEGLYAR